MNRCCIADWQKAPLKNSSFSKNSIPNHASEDPPTGKRGRVAQGNSAVGRNHCINTNRIPGCKISVIVKVYRILISQAAVIAAGCLKDGTIDVEITPGLSVKMEKSSVSLEMSNQLNKPATEPAKK